MVITLNQNLAYIQDMFFGLRIMSIARSSYNEAQLIALVNSSVSLRSKIDALDIIEHYGGKHYLIEKIRHRVRQEYAEQIIKAL